MPTRESRPPSLQQLIASADRPVLVDFYADWCAPCNLIAPLVKRIARELSERLLVVKVDTDRKSEIAAHYQVASIPTLLLFRKGQPVLRLQGALSYERILSEIERNLPCIRPSATDHPRV